MNFLIDAQLPERLRTHIQKLYNLLLVSTGNIANDELERIFFANFGAIVEGFGEYAFIEVDREALRFHF